MVKTLILVDNPSSGCVPLQSELRARVTAESPRKQYSFTDCAGIEFPNQAGNEYSVPKQMIESWRTWFWNALTEVNLSRPSIRKTFVCSLDLMSHPCNAVITYFSACEFRGRMFLLKDCCVHIGSRGIRLDICKTTGLAHVFLCDGLSDARTGRFVRGIGKCQWTYLVTVVQCKGWSADKL